MPGYQREVMLLQGAGFLIKKQASALSVWAGDGELAGCDGGGGIGKREKAREHMLLWNMCVQPAGAGACEMVCGAECFGAAVTKRTRCAVRHKRKVHLGQWERCTP